MDKEDCYPVMEAERQWGASRCGKPRGASKEGYAGALRVMRREEDKCIW